MKKYTGTFKTLYDKTITVDIIPSDFNYTETVELKFPFEEPVIIEQDSEGFYSPLRSKTCTIKIFTDEIYWDLYTASATGYYVDIYSTRSGDLDSFHYFQGFLTPCMFSQDYVCKGEIELEAVDMIATLSSFQYTTEERSIITVHDLIKKLFSYLPTYGRLFTFTTTFDATKYYIQESNFFDDDDEPMTCQEILEELMKYFGTTAVHFNSNIEIFQMGVLSKTPNLKIESTLYGEGTPSVEVDDVYNKIRIGCDLYEVDNLIDDVFDDDNKTIVNEFKMADTSQIYADYTFSFRKWYHHTTDSHRYNMLIKPYQFVDSTIADNKVYLCSRWKTYNRKLSDKTLDTTTTDQEKAVLDTMTYKYNGKYIFVPNYSGAYPIRQYVYNKAEGKASKDDITWEDMILFPIFTTKASTYYGGTVYPAITFNNDNELSYSLDSGTGYIIFNADLWLQTNLSLDGGPDKDIIWTTAMKGSTEVDIPVPVCYSNMDLTFDNQQAGKRESGDTGYNTGWNLVKAQLKIGDKYWNGSAWTTTESTFSINYHDDDVDEDDETFNFFNWTKPVQNYKGVISDEGYAIPITAADNLYGKLEFTLYTPLTYSYEKPSNMIFMRDLSLKYVYSDSSAWGDDTTIEDDIVYENIIDTSYCNEMDELDLKINSWYKDKPMSKSYILNESKRPVVTTTLNGTTEIQEVRLLDMYSQHYEEPKRIFNLNHRYFFDGIDDDGYYIANRENVYITHCESETQTTPTTYYLDSFEFDLKKYEINMKLIEK